MDDEARPFGCDKLEWWDVCRFINPGKDWAEFEAEWAEHQAAYRADKKREALN